MIHIPQQNFYGASPLRGDIDIDNAPRSALNPSSILALLLVAVLSPFILVTAAFAAALETI
jgi:hypothetical protein